MPLNRFMLIVSLISASATLPAQSPTHSEENHLIIDLYTQVASDNICPIRQLAGYPYNPYVSPDVWQILEPYFLPLNHPIKAKLDRIFSKTRATLSPESFEAAGFGKVKLRQPGNLVIGRHPNLKGYLVKAYLDTQIPLPEWSNWINRIQGAESIQACLKKHRYRSFTVPKKWIYPLPAEPSPPNNGLYNRKNFILVVEDMNILSSDKNLKAYQKKITPEILDALYVILSEEGLLDSVYPDNIPFTKTGEIAFIDTEHHHKWPIPYDRLARYLSPNMQRYWQQLIQQQGPKINH